MNKLYDILNTFISECNCAAGMASYESLPRRVKPRVDNIDEGSELSGTANAMAQDAGSNSMEIDIKPITTIRSAEEAAKDNSTKEDISEEDDED